MDPNQNFSYQQMLNSSNPTDSPTSQQPNPYYPYQPPVQYNSPYPEFSSQCSIGGEAVGSPDVIANTKGKSIPTKEGVHERRVVWKINEDKVLVSAYLNNSNDSIVGTDQSGSSFWMKVTNYFNDYNEGGFYRDVKACKNRWHNLNGQVSKFVGAYNQAKARKRSGESENDILYAAHKIFEADSKKKFTLEHVWYMLRDHPKWMALGVESSSKRSKINERGNYSSSSSGTPSVPNTPSFVGDPSTPTNQNTNTFDGDFTPDEHVPVRPIRVKAAKRKVKEKAKANTSGSESQHETSRVMNVYIETQKALTTALNENARAKKIQVYTKLAAKETLSVGEQRMYSLLEAELFSD